MSLCMMVAQPGGAHLITDGGVWNESDVLIGYGRKVALFPDMSVAIGYTGFGGHADWIEEAVARASLTTTRDLLRNLSTVLRDLVERHGSTEPGKGLKLFVITYDPEPGSACWAISSDGENLPPNYRPFAIMPLRGWIDFADPSAVLGRPVTLTDPASFDVVRDGAKLAQAAREMPWDDGGGGAPIYHVGMFAELTTVGPGGLTQQRLCEWPEDRVGERTDPFKRAA